MSESNPIPILQIGDILLASIQIDLKDTMAGQFQDDLLLTVQRTGATGVVIDISGLEIVDSYVARILAETGRMARYMGARTVLVGMRPSVAATLVRMGFEMTDVDTALNLDDGLALLGARMPTE